MTCLVWLTAVLHLLSENVNIHNSDNLSLAYYQKLINNLMMSYHLSQVLDIITWQWNIVW